MPTKRKKSSRANGTSFKKIKQEEKPKKGIVSPIAGIGSSAGGQETLNTYLEREQSETTLQNSQEMLLKAQQVARMGFWSRGFKTDEIYWSDQIYNLYGIDILRKKPDIDLTIELVHPEDRELVEKNYNMAVLGIKEYDIQHRILRPDGKVIWVHSRAKLTCDAGGIPESLIGTVVDITELKETAETLRKSEERYRSLVDFTDDSIYLVDRNGRYQFINKKYLSRFNRPLDEIINRPYSEFHSQQATKKFQNDLKTIFETGKSLQYEHKSEKDGRYFIRTLTPVKDAGGTVAAVTIISKDITEKKNIEAQLLQAQKMEAMGTLVAGVAHEINNPNSLIMLNVPILQDVWRDIQPIVKQHALKEPQKKYGGLTYTYIDTKLKTLLSDMRIAAARIASIIKKLKDFARPSDIDDKQPVQINDAVENAIRLAQATLRKSRVEPEVALSENLPLIQGDLGSIEQIVLNLLINALEATGRDQGKIKLTTGVTKKDSRVYLSVADNGQGIDPSISDKIFDPFVTTKQEKGGTGLGLSVTYSLVKAHDGEIRFKSKAGKETVFTVSFPTGLKKSLSKILVVDDDKSIRKMLVRALIKHQNIAVEETSNGTEALIKLGFYCPDLLILDIFMPEVNGVEVCRAIRKNPELSDMKVVIITGFSNDPKLKQIEKMGFTNIYFKPLNLKNFVKEVDNLLKNKVDSRQ